MVAKLTVQEVLAEALALPEDDRGVLAAKLLASLPKRPSGPSRSLLSLAGRGAGAWGDDSTATLNQQRDEWR
jgi:hypothetical protein